jgi:hypothetical protein
LLSTPLLRACLAVLLGSFARAGAATPELQLTATSPELPARLAAQEAFYVRIAYQSDQPLRFQAAGYFQGAKKANLMMNPSPVYPAGSGEAVAWIAGDAGTVIDEVRVVGHDARWKPLREVSLPAAAAWHAGIAANPPAAWARELNNAQQQLVGRDLQQASQGTGGLWDRIVDAVMPFVFGSIAAYPLLQAFALWRLRGARRLLAALPLTFMLPTYAFCIYALWKNSNLWPLPAIFLSPVAALLVLGMLIYFRFKRLPTAEPPPAK